MNVLSGATSKDVQKLAQLFQCVMNKKITECKWFYQFSVNK